MCVCVERETDVDAIAALMQQAGFEISPIHGNLTFDERDKVMAGFRSGKTKVLITTNVLARGIDIPSVAVVVNFDLPLKFDKGQYSGDEALYLHRIGRCGRFGRRGTAITFIEKPEDFRYLEQIERFYSPSRPLTTEWDPNDIEALSAEIKSRPAPNLEGAVEEEGGLAISTFQGDAK